MVKEGIFLANLDFVKKLTNIVPTSNMSCKIGYNQPLYVASWETRSWSLDLARDESCPTVKLSLDKPSSMLGTPVA
jgi:hypothetical protein